MHFKAIFCLFFLCINTAFANPLQGTSPGFDVKKANQQFDRINLQLSVQNLNINHLEIAVDQLSTLIENSDNYIAELQKKLNNTELLIKQGGGFKDAAVGDKKEGADLIYLETQQKALADEQAQCRLFSIRANEAVEVYKTAIAELKQEQALTRSLPLWKIITEALDDPSKLSPVSPSLTKIAVYTPSLFSSLISMVVALIGSFIILRRLKTNRLTRHHLKFKSIRPHHIILLASTMLATAWLIYLVSIFQELTLKDISLALSSVLVFYLMALTLLVGFFKAKKVRAFFYWYSLEYSFFEALGIAALSLCMASNIGELFLKPYKTSDILWQLCASLFLLVILATGGYFIHKFCQIHRQFFFVKHHRSFIKRFSLVLLTGCALLDVLGYLALAQHLTFSIFVTFSIVFITLLITQGLSKLYLMLNQQQSIRFRLIKYFGYRTDQVFAELLILKMVAQFIIIAISIYLIGQSWTFLTNAIDIIYDPFINGIHIANTMFYPTRMISGVIVFCTLYLIFRAISTAISSQQQFEDEEETQVAVASILTYLGFGLAMIAGFLVAGFNFTGLAIIAGALSVGIGLGLQSIVNNFVSGLILLVEKPIRPGDRINVDGLEGFVKKIRVRSTQIITPSREDIIVPNSDLITRPVINYMFSDRYCHITCDVGVAYGSDTHKIRDILLEVAHNNDEVMKTGRNKPTVLFRSFADSALMFQLGCLIEDVNKKLVVQSELNFAIENAFREHHIDMPFPQREIHLKFTETKPPLMKEPSSL